MSSAKLRKCRTRSESDGFLLAEVPREGAKGRLFLGEVSLQFTAQGLQFRQVGFDILRKDIFQPLAHALGQDGRFSVCADGELEGAVGDNASHVEIASLWDVGHIEEMPHQATQAHRPPDFPRFNGGHHRDVVAPHLPRPSPPVRDGAHVLVLVDERLHRLTERRRKDANPRMGAAFEKEVQFFFGDFRPSEDVEGETFGLEEDGELGIHR